MNAQTLVNKVWSFCHTLRDDGVGYGDYLEQLTYLIFLKLADEYARPPYNREVGIPVGYDWSSLKRLKGAELEAHYIETLRLLGQEEGMLGQIFMKAQNKIQDPAKLARVIEMIDAEDWAMLGSDVKGDLYEGLLEKNAEDVKSGGGAVLHSAGAHRGHGGLLPPGAAEDDRRPGLRYRRFLPQGLRLHY